MFAFAKVRDFGGRQNGPPPSEHCEVLHIQKNLNFWPFWRRPTRPPRTLEHIRFTSIYYYLPQIACNDLGDLPTACHFCASNTNVPIVLLTFRTLELCRKYSAYNLRTSQVSLSRTTRTSVPRTLATDRTHTPVQSTHERPELHSMGSPLLLALASGVINLITEYLGGAWTYSEIFPVPSSPLRRRCWKHWHQRL